MGRHLMLNIVEKARDQVYEVLKAVNGGGKELKEYKQRVVENLYASIGTSCDDAKTRMANKVLDEVATALRSLEYCVVDLKFRSSSRLLIGSSGGPLAAIFEVGVAWDMILDVPYIPGSSIKGLLRSYLLRRCSELDDQGDRRGCVQAVIEVFGASKRFSKDEARWFREVLGGSLEVKEPAAGLVFCSDAYLVEPVCDDKAVGGMLVPDVLTPHYYRGGRVVKDEFEAEPVPVVHLSVPAGTVFRLVIGVDPSAKSSLDPLIRYLSGGKSGGADPGIAVASILKAALEEGLGGRTTKGYGRLEPVGLKAGCGDRGRSRRRPPTLRFKEGVGGR